jgi:hypothetical protein
MRENPDKVKDSGTGSTTVTARMHERLTFPLRPVIVILYFPNKVDVVADTCKVVEDVAPAVSIMGFTPPITPRKPKGTVAERVTDPLKPFLLPRIILVEFVIPATTLTEYGLAYRPKSASEFTITVNSVELATTFLPAEDVPVAMML